MTPSGEGCTPSVDLLVQTFFDQLQFYVTVGLTSHEILAKAQEAMSSGGSAALVSVVVTATNVIGWYQLCPLLGAAMWTATGFAICVYRAEEGFA